MFLGRAGNVPVYLNRKYAIPWTDCADSELLSLVKNLPQYLSRLSFSMLNMRIRFLFTYLVGWRLTLYSRIFHFYHGAFLSYIWLGCKQMTACLNVSDL